MDTPEHHSNHPEESHFFTVTVLVHGEPRKETYPKNEKVRAIIVGLLPPADRPHADQYMLTDASLTPPRELSPDESLEHGGVLSGHILSLTKRDGGGGQ